MTITLNSLSGYGRVLRVQLTCGFSDIGEEHLWQAMPSALEIQEKSIGMWYTGSSSEAVSMHTHLS